MLTVFDAKNNKWRDSYNPLRGMGLPRLLSLLDAGERGQYADLQWFYHFMERSDAMVFSVLQRRRAALLSCDWDIREVSECGSNGVSEREKSQTAKDAKHAKRDCEQPPSSRDYGAPGETGGNQGAARSQKGERADDGQCSVIGQIEAGWIWSGTFPEQRWHLPVVPRTGRHCAGRHPGYGRAA